MAHRINGGSVVVALGGALLLTSLFLDWYEPNLSAWDTFELADLVLAAAALTALATVLRPVLTQRPTPDPARERVLFFIGAGALIVVIASLIQAPPAAHDSSPELGAWLGLAGAALITIGGLVAGSRISVVITRRPNESVTPPSGVDPVPPPAGTQPAPPESETSTIPAEPR